MVIKENIDKDKVLKHIEEKGNNLKELTEDIIELSEASMAEHPFYEEAMVLDTESEEEIADQVMKQLIDNYEKYKKQTKHIVGE